MAKTAEVRVIVEGVPVVKIMEGIAEQEPETEIP